MQYIVKLTLKVNNSNFHVDDAAIRNWAFHWKNNVITAYSSIWTKGNVKPQVYEMLEDVSTLNLGLLVDLLTFTTNVGVNTNITISLEINYVLFEVSGVSNPKKISQYEELISSGKKIEQGISDKEWPVRTDFSITTNLSLEEQTLANYLLDELSKKARYTDAELKILNYWRRGVDLENLTYWDESFLSFFKILEYFKKRCNIPNAAIPAKYKTDKEKDAYRISLGAGLAKINKGNIKLLTEFIDIRNNWDVAHTRVKYMPKSVEGGMYFTYYYNMWGTYHHLKDVARLFILSFLGIKKMQLIVDGGLFKLQRV
jgi:hypothetical protein